MPRLGIVVEGHTEYYFVNEILSNRLPSSIEVTPINLRGGSISIERLYEEVAGIEHSFDYTSTMVDYYEFKNKNALTVDELEKELAKKIGGEYFIPYIQKYEFEALIFADKQLLIEKFSLKLEQVKQIAPEDINHANPPSKQIGRLYPRYIKTTHGIQILKEIDWNKLKSNCPRFGKWIDKLEKIDN